MKISKGLIDSKLPAVTGTVSRVITLEFFKSAKRVNVLWLLTESFTPPPPPSLFPVD